MVIVKPERNHLVQLRRTGPDRMDDPEHCRAGREDYGLPL